MPRLTPLRGGVAGSSALGDGRHGIFYLYIPSAQAEALLPPGPQDAAPALVPIVAKYCEIEDGSSEPFSPQAPGCDLAEVDGALIVTTSAALFVIDIDDEEAVPVPTLTFGSPLRAISPLYCIGTSMFVVVLVEGRSVRLARVETAWEGKRLKLGRSADWTMRLLPASLPLPTIQLDDDWVPRAAFLNNAVLLPLPDGLWSARLPDTGDNSKWEQVSCPLAGYRLRDGRWLRRLREQQVETLVLEAARPGEQTRLLEVRVTPGGIICAPKTVPSNSGHPRVTPQGVFVSRDNGKGGQRVEMLTTGPMSPVDCDSGNVSGLATLEGGVVIVEQPDRTQALQLSVRLTGGRIPLQKNLALGDVQGLGDPLVMGRWAAVVWRNEETIQCSWVCAA